MGSSTPLVRLRDVLNNQKIDYLIITSNDAHLSEFVAPQDARLAYISGFGGSYGLGIVCSKKSKGYLWTDSRYWIQAEKQLDSNEWQLMRVIGQSGVTPYAKLQEIAQDSTVAIDPRTVSASEMRRYLDACASRNVSWIWTEDNLVDQIWSGREKLFDKVRQISIVPPEIHGMDSKEKFEQMVSQMTENDVTVIVLTTLDDIAWLLNMRGSDVPYNPIFFSFLVIERTKKEKLLKTATLFVDPSKVADELLIRYLRDKNVQVRPYETFYDYLDKFDKSYSVWLDTDKCSYSVYRILEQNATIIRKGSPVALMKAVKNPVEIEGMRKCHIEDGAALVEFFHWLTCQLEDPNCKEKLDEFSLAAKELEFRSKRKFFVSPSFETISSVDSNAAIVHYSPTSESASFVLSKESIYLNDSGGQYLNGTTDVTRTWHFGTPTEWQMRCYTYVLKGFIALSAAKFPQNVSANALDVLTRCSLWKAGLDYAHGTGHGVGHYLNVHESHPGISVFASHRNSKPLESGNCTSIEPGYYEEGQFGIRIENVVVVRESDIGKHLSRKPFLEFEQLTMAPINTTLIIRSLLEASEITFLNNYHQLVWQKVSPRVSEGAREWLREATKPIS